MPLLSCKLLVLEPWEKQTGKKIIPTRKTQIHPQPQNFSFREDKTCKKKMENLFHIVLP